MKKLIIIPVLVLILVLTACSKPSDIDGGKVLDKRQTIEAMYANDEKNKPYLESFLGIQAPDFKLTNLNGEEISLEDYKGKKVILEIAKTTCPACVEVYPILKEFEENNDIEVIQVFPADTKEELLNFFDENNVEPSKNTIAGNGNLAIAEAYQIRYTPTMIFINEEGIIELTHIGSFSDTKLSDLTKIAFEMK